MNPQRKDALHLIVIGPPGAGKSTQCNRLAERFNLEQLSTGDLMRRELESGSLLGQFLDEHWQLNKISEIAADLTAINAKKALARGKGFILDGSPRTLAEAKLLAAAFAEHEIGLDGVIELEVDESEATKRLLSRSVHQLSGRIYNLETHPPQTPGIDDITGEELIQRPEDFSLEGVNVRFCSYRNCSSGISQFFKEQPESGSPPFFRVDANDREDIVYAELVRVVEPLEDLNSKRAMASLPTTEETKRESEDKLVRDIPTLQRVTPADAAIILQQIKILVRSNKPATRFPGCHPVSLTSKNILQLLDDDYRIAPKIDGERRFLVLLNQRLYLVDRRTIVQRFPSAHFPPHLNRTVFDGELVARNQPTFDGAGSTSPSWCFVIFDAVCAEGEYICHLPLNERLDRAKAVVEQLDSVPFTLMFQDYFRLDRIEDVFHQLRRQDTSAGQVLERIEEEDTTVGVLLSADTDEDQMSSNAGRFPTDGLLFVPVYNPYRLGYCERMMKWKAPSDNTIDFTLRSIYSTREQEEGPQTEVKEDQEAVGGDNDGSEKSKSEQNKEDGQANTEGRRYWQLFVLRDSNNYVFYDWIEFDDINDVSDAEELKRQHGIEDDAIIECHWDPAKKVAHIPPPALLSMWGQGWSNGKGGWRFHRVRRDKTTPNAEWVVRNIEESIWDSLNEEDITVFINQNATTIRRLIKEGPKFDSRPNSRSRSYSNSYSTSKRAVRRNENDHGGYRMAQSEECSSSSSNTTRWKRKNEYRANYTLGEGDHGDSASGSMQDSWEGQIISSRDLSKRTAASYKHRDQHQQRDSHNRSYRGGLGRSYSDADVMSGSVEERMDTSPSRSNKYGRYYYNSNSFQKNSNQGGRYGGRGEHPFAYDRRSPTEQLYENFKAQHARGGRDAFSSQASSPNPAPRYRQRTTNREAPTTYDDTLLHYEG